MSEEADRSAKRRRISSKELEQPTRSPAGPVKQLNSATTPHSISRASPRPLITYGSSKSQKAVNGTEWPKSQANTDDHVAASQDADPVPFADSAYYSVSTHEEPSEEEVGDIIHTRGTRRGGMIPIAAGQDGFNEEDTPSAQPTPTKRKRNKQITNGEDELADETLKTGTSKGNRAGVLHIRTNAQSGGPTNHRPDAALLEPLVVVTSTARKAPETESQEGSVRSSGRQRKPTHRAREQAIEAEKLSTPTKPPGRKRGRPPTSATNTPSLEQREQHFVDSHSSSGVNDILSGVPNVTSIPPINPILEIEARPIPDSTPGKGAKKKQTPRGILGAGPDTEADKSTQDHLDYLNSVLENGNMEDAFEVLKTGILEHLTGRRRLPLIGVDDEFQKTYQLVQQTIVAGEGNSMLIIGSRGSGKTTLVETVLSQVAEEHRDDFYVVRLNGFIHTDDKLALKEIWRQLGREMETDDESRSNYADTLTSLLALLAHPTEHAAVTTVDETQTAKSIVFVMDEFDLFATHSRQTLLYNLFEIAQSRKAPIAVLGLTTRIGVIESLEKRVKSRFSHRYVHLPLPKTFGAFRDICKAALMCEMPDSSSSVLGTFAKGQDRNNAQLQRLHRAWSSYISSILMDDPAIGHLMRRIYAHTKSVSDFMTACLIPICSMSPRHIPSAAEFTANTLSPADSKLHILPGLSEVELALLIAAARLEIVLDTNTCNFNMAYDEYLSVAGRAKMLSSASGAAALGGGARVWGKEVALGAWERLEALELLVPVVGAAGGGGGAGAGVTTDVGRAGRLWKVDVGLEEIGASRLDMSSVMVKWCKEI